MCSEWEFLIEHPTFLSKFVPTIIEKQRSISVNISEFYILFYTSPIVISTSPEVEELLNKSISSRIGQLAAIFEFKIQKTLLLANNTNVNEGNCVIDSDKALNNEDGNDNYEKALKDLNDLTEFLFQILNQRKVKTSPKHWMPMIAMVLLATPLNSCQLVIQIFQSIPKFVSTITAITKIEISQVMMILIMI